MPVKSRLRAVATATTIAALFSALLVTVNTKSTRLDAHAATELEPITMDLLESLGPLSIVWSDKDGEHTYTGVPLIALLKNLGFEAGRHGADVPVGEKFLGYRQIVIATARDGFTATFSCAELDPDNGLTEAYVVWKKDGAPLPDERGPFRVIVKSDKLGARSVYQLSTLTRVNPQDARSAVTHQLPDSRSLPL